ncbi:MAG TPA: 2-dehydropantoate 2-reductase [Candidatus Acidoferrales bacterium]
MRITIMGSGGVGGYFGARLVQGGCDVGFVARGAHLAALREDGLRVESPLGGIHLPHVRVSDDPVALGPADYVFICVKLWDTESAARAVAPIVGSETAVISFQNGVQKEDTLRRVFGEKRVMGGLGYIGSSIARPGVIRHIGTMQKLAFGEFEGGTSERGAALLDACRRGGIDAELLSDVRRALWEKFVFIVGLSAATTSMRATIGPIRSNPASRAFLLDVMREVVAVGRAHGVGLAEDYAEQRLTFCDGLSAEMTSSMHNDLQHGNRLELDWLSGGVVELGKAVGVPTPTNRAVAGILSLYAHGRPPA